MESWLDSEDEDYDGEEGDLSNDEWMDALDQAEAQFNLGEEEDGMDEKEEDTETTGSTDSPTHSNPSATTFTTTPLAFQHKVFTETPGPTDPLGSDATPLDAFLQVFGKDTCEHIAEQTNLYVQQNPPPDGYRWYPTSANEILLFLGMVICMGIIRLPATVDYWSTNPLLSVHAISNCMPVRRFKALLRTLHLNDNTKAKRPGEDGYDKLFKVRPLLDEVLKNSSSLYVPHREVSIDEGMVLFKGRSSYKQYMPQKPVKRGFKVWCLAVSRNGYLQAFEVYTGATEESSFDGLGATVVKRLTSILKKKGYHLYFDNFFSSVDLAHDLLQDDLYCVATTRTNRKKWPTSMKDTKAQNKALKRGEHISTVVGGSVECIVWKDNKCVPFINTITQPGLHTTVPRKQKDGRHQDVSCPLPVKLYNQHMGGVDLADSRRKLYSCSRKLRRWWMRLFYFLVDVSVINSHVLTQESPQCFKLSLKEYVLKLAGEMMSQHNSRKRKGRPSGDGPPSGRFCDRHFPTKGSKQQECHVCSSKVKRVRTLFT